MTRRVLAIAGGSIAVASAVGLAVYFAVAGFRLADTVGVIGAVVGIAGLALAVYGAATDRRAPEEKQPSPTVTQRARTSGHGRTNQAGGDQTINEK